MPSMTDTDDTATPPSTDGPTRVPNVSPGARSGIDHTVIGSAAQDAHDAQQDAADPEDEDPTGTDDGTTPDPAEQDTEGSDDGTTPDAADQPTEGSDDGTAEEGTVVGESVESDTAGTGEAVNADTGEVTAPGDQLPTIEQEDGTPLPQ